MHRQMPTIYKIHNKQSNRKNNNLASDQSSKKANAKTNNDPNPKQQEHIKRTENTKRLNPSHTKPTPQPTKRLKQTQPSTPDN
jgi:hypothetical protein